MVEFASESEEIEIKIIPIIIRARVRNKSGDFFTIFDFQKD